MLVFRRGPLESPDAFAERVLGAWSDGATVAWTLAGRAPRAAILTLAGRSPSDSRSAVCSRRARMGRRVWPWMLVLGLCVAAIGRRCAAAARRAD